MKIRILSIACITAAVALLAACTATFRNSDACEQLMRNKLADSSVDASADSLRVAHRGAGIHGSRVVIEGSIEHVTTASEAAATAASAAAAASAARVAASAHGASAVRAAGAGGASAVSATSPASAVSVEAAAASDVVAASDAKSVPTKPAKPVTVVTAAAAECTFNGPDLNVFRWLAPAKLATPPDEAASATAG